MVPGSSSGQPRAALVDELSVTYPDPSFIQNAMTTLSSAGYTVEYLGPIRAGVQSFQDLPRGGYTLVIIRAHTAGSTIITSQP
jgi:hypothetical protein